MSLTKRYLESQPEFIEGSNAAAIKEAIENVRSAACRVDRIENLSDLSFLDIESISRSLHLAITRLERLSESAQSVPQ